MERIAEEGSGVVVILHQHEDAHELVARIQRYHELDEGIPQPNRGQSSNLRTYGVGAQILRDLGVRRMRVLSAPKTMRAISGFDLEVTDYVTE
jgi:3,4-dihydroxy 2-butanone 4-phosphate synthase/GTP cyclohydrolase II